MKFYKIEIFKKATKRSILARFCVVLIVIFWLVLPVCAEKPNKLQSMSNGYSTVGDIPMDVPPLTKDLSPDLNKKSIDKAIRKVGNWELNRSQKYFDQGWEFATLYAGFMSAADALPDRKYLAAMLQMGNRFEWKLAPPPGDEKDADFYVVGQTYLDLYQIYRQPRMLEPTKSQSDQLMKLSENAKSPVWSWCDALFMGPPTWVRLYRATGNKRYLDYMDRQWWMTSNLLYRPEYSLYARDASYLHRVSKNGKPLFWSRGNGWVIAGLARVLEIMPADYPSRPKYVEQFRQMASAITALQGEDGLWRADLLDPEFYPAPEVSGSALDVFAIAWGINHGILDKNIYFPVVQKGWKGLLSHIYQDGRLGAIQPVGGAPNIVQPSSSYVYGVGTFLLAGSELRKLAVE